MLKKSIFYPVLLFILTLSAVSVHAQKKDEEKKPPVYDVAWNSFSFRSIGPAFTSGRIADFAVNPDNPSEFYVGTAAGGVWKTTNRGLSFDPIFDDQGSYSIGVVEMDPNNHNVIWVGTGENNNQRSVSYGDGIYKSVDGGKSWEHKGLKNSEHIGMIAIDPTNSDVVYVAATGPVWSAGGDRGLFKTTDGGDNWDKILEISEHTGIHEVHLDPRNSNVIYAVAHQRRRHVFTYISGGPESSVYKSTDGGKNFRKITKGLPGGDLGRIGLDISPANPDVIYAVVEAQEDKGGFYRSTDLGESWERRSDYSSSGNYYQEVIADPVDVDRVYVMNTFAGVSDDGGKTFNNVGEKNKHIDNHALWIDPNNNNYLLNGNDGGVYESWDQGKTWRFFPNLPVTQFYKLGVSTDYPFYYVYGGTQDNFTIGGPSQTTETTGITNRNWFVTTLGDGFEPHVDPENPDIIYSQSQYGNLSRFDRKTGETQNIVPQPPDGDYSYNWNWDAPLLISNHDNKRLYYASDRLHRSDDRGQSWKEVSGDLTRQMDRNQLKVMGKIWPMDAVAKNASTTEFGNIVAIAESPLDEDLLFAGTDDGLVHISSDGGENWTRYSSFPGVPNMTYVNEIIASAHDENTVYVAFNNHKRGDFKPYLLKSTNLGQSWTSINANLPERGSTYAIAEDPEAQNLLFVGTEFGCFATLDGGKYWKKLSKGLPTIAVRDINIQKREKDLVLGTFGRGFYIMDDYSALRDLSNELLGKEAHIFPVSEALQYEPYSPIAASKTISWLGPKGFQGETYYLGENPPFGAAFTYYLKEKYSTLKDKREKEEGEKRKDGENVFYPSYNQLKAEKEEEKSFLIFTIRDANGEFVNEIRTGASEGINRVHWDLKYPAIDQVQTNLADPSKNLPSGIMVLPGTYSVELAKSIDGEVTQLVEPVTFEVKTLDNRTIPPADPAAMLAFHQQLMKLSKSANGARRAYNQLQEALNYYQAAARVVNSSSLNEKLDMLEEKLEEIQITMYGDPIKRQLEIDQAPSLSNRVNTAIYTGTSSFGDPTGTSKQVKQIAEKYLDPVIASLKQIMSEDVPAINAELDANQAPWTPGRIIEIKD
ncbi:WD40/YVTN/BNR-like repeat-containing protein [Ekhidna sp.]|uniref:WD40/YVTN/BNR-like repeat-containing protein n=1 Tax=Ekhidna sp. TaxID=2608089 RepID=UPI003BA8E732